MAKTEIFVAFTLISVLLSSSILSSTRAPQFALADESQNNSTQAVLVDKTTAEKESEAADENTNAPQNSISVKDKEDIQPRGNRAPKANAGPDLIVTSGDKVVLNAESSTDPDGDKLTFIWNQVLPKKPHITLKNSGIKKIMFLSPKVDKTTDFTFKLSVHDGKGGIAKDSVSIKVVVSKSSRVTPERRNQVDMKNISSLSINKQKVNSGSHLKSKGSSLSASDSEVIGQFSGSLHGIGKSPFSNCPDNTGLYHPCEVTFEELASFSGPLVNTSDHRIVPGPEGAGWGQCTQNVITEFLDTGETNTISDSWPHRVGFPPSSEPSPYLWIGGHLDIDPEQKKLSFSFSAVNAIGLICGSGISTSQTPFQSSSDGSISASGGESGAGQTTEWSLKLNSQNQKPNAVAKIKFPAPPALPNPNEDVTLTGLSSSDPDEGDSIKKFTWKQISGTTVILDDIHSAEPVFSFPTDGNTESVKFTLTVTDSHGTESEPATVEVKVNHAPKAAINISPPGPVEPNTLVTLDASASKDIDAGDEIVRYTWKQGETDPTPDKIVFSSLNGKITTFKAPGHPTTLHLELGLTDKNFGFTTANKEITVVQAEANQPPFADAGPPQTANPGEVVQLHGTASDPDGDPITTEWIQLEKTENTTVTLSDPSTLEPTFTAPNVPGAVLKFQFGVTDDKLAVAFSPTQVTLKKQIKLSVEIDKSEINPYPVNINPPKPQSTITVTAKYLDGTPAQRIQLDIKACPTVGGSNTDGHVHDISTQDSCFHSSRPRPFLVSSGKIGDPLIVTTDNAGIAKVDYTPSASPTSDYISGRDQIVASVKDDPNTKDESKFIITRVPGLVQMTNSQSCPGGTDSYYFETQSKHDCLFYGTQNTVSDLKDLANDFKQRQVDCAKARNPRTEPACDVTPEGASQREKIFAVIKGDPIPIKITAMSLPWGGLLDSDGNWNAPETTHNDGNNVDLGFNVKGQEMTIDQKRLLRDVILDSGQLLPYDGEGKEADVSLAKDHFHIQFVSCEGSSPSPSSTGLKATAGEPGFCATKVKVSGSINVETPDGRKFLSLPNLKVELCSASSRRCVASTPTDKNGDFGLEALLQPKDAQVKISLINVPTGVTVTKFPNHVEASFVVSDIIFKANAAKTVYTAFLDIKLQDIEPYFDIIGNQQQDPGTIGNVVSVSNVDEKNFAHLAAVYYYIERALSYSIPNFPSVSQTFKTPLLVQGFYDEPPCSPKCISQTDGNDSPRITIRLEPDDSRLAGFQSEEETKEDIDTMYHEFGHYLDFQIQRGRLTGKPILNVQFALPNLGVKMNLPHMGYALVDSSSSFKEARADFFCLLLEEKVLDGASHKYYIDHMLVQNGDNFETPIPKYSNIVGEPLPGSTKAPYFVYEPFAEEYSIVSLLWDLHDNTPKEKIFDGTTKGKDIITLPLNDMLNSLIKSTYTIDFYRLLIDTYHFKKDEPLRAGINSSFVSLKIYDDVNGNNKFEKREHIGTTSWEAFIPPPYNGNTFLYDNVRY